MLTRYCTLLLLACCLYTTATAQQPSKPDSSKAKKDSLADAIKGRQKFAGLFTLYQDTTSGSLLMYIKKNQVGKDREFIYQSFSMGGPAGLFLNQNMIRETWIFNIQKRYNKLEFNRVNTNYYYDSSNAVSKSANVDVSDAVFYNDKIIAEDSSGYLLNIDELFLSDKLDAVKPQLSPMLPPGAVFTLGGLNPSKSGYEKIRSYPNNTDVVVSLAYDNPVPFNNGGDNVTDARYVRVKMQHSFIEMPKNDYKPRFADPKVGYFSQERSDMTSKTAFNYNDLINRWYLKKKDPSAALSEPVEPITWWIENTTPVELRPIIMEAGLKWNEAFEKAGFKNAVVMKIMPDDASWDPADIRYNVIRWVSSDLGYAIGPSFVNPRTGQILGADITIDYGFYSGVLAEQSIGDPEAMFRFDDVMPEKANSIHHNNMNCSISKGTSRQYSLGRLVADLDADSDVQKDNLLKQFFTELVLHEMGHTMGLNHNMKASQMLTPLQLQDKVLTRRLGTMGSVMDYSAVNISLDRSKQGDYYTTKTGPYDWWAIEYGYTPYSNAQEEEAGLKRILSRSNDPQLAFGNDADIVSYGSGIDPRVQVWDMSGDMAAYATDRFKLVNDMMTKLKSRYATPGKTYSDLTWKYYILNGQRNAMASALSKYIGGVYVDRSVVGQGNTQPYTPVPLEYQKKVMKTLSSYLFAPNAFSNDAALFPYLQLQRRGYRFGGKTEDPKPDMTALSLQSNVINYLLYPTTLRRTNTTTLYGNTYSAANVLSDLTTAIFNEDLKTNVNLYRQNLQTEYLKQIVGIVNGANSSAYDHPSRAAALATLKLLRSKLATAVSTNEQTKAHRASLQFMIEKALAVK
jgi:hypothetical protein